MPGNASTTDDAAKTAVNAPDQSDWAMANSDAILTESSSPAQPQSHQLHPLLKQEQEQQQQDGKNSMHISETRYELGPELMQVRRVWDSASTFERAATPL